MSIFIQGREPGCEVWPKCYACEEDIEERMYTIFGHQFCHACAVEYVRDNLVDELIDDFLANRVETPTYEFVEEY